MTDESCVSSQKRKNNVIERIFEIVGLEYKDVYDYEDLLHVVKSIPVLSSTGLAILDAIHEIIKLLESNLINLVELKLNELEELYHFYVYWD